MTNNVNWKYLLDPEKTNKDKARQIVLGNHITYWTMYLRILISIIVFIFLIISSVFASFKVWL